MIISKIRFVNQLLITDNNFSKAQELTSNIDSDDLPFVSLSLQFKSKLWTGDKQLIKGLSNKGFKQVITTNDLFQLYLDKELKSRNR